jgi:hypothetical protein
MRRVRRLVAIASSAGLLAAPAAASGHGSYNLYEPGATAPDGHHVVSVFDRTPPVPQGWYSGQLNYYECVWSDGTVDDCEGVTDYF